MKPKPDDGTSTVARRPVGRPPGLWSYTPDIATRVLSGLEAGETLAAICAAPGMPRPATVRLWAREDVQGFQAAYALGKEMQAHAVAEGVLQGARDATDAALGRLQMDAAKWFAAKLLPKVYGDRVAVDAKFAVEESRSREEILVDIAARTARLGIGRDNGPTE